MANKDQKLVPHLDRRRFLSVAGSGAASLIGTSMLTRHGWARPGEAAADGNSVTVRTHEHFGEIEEQLVFPGTWELKVQHMKGHGRPELSPAQVREKLDHPIDSPTLRELAEGKETAVITFDDLTRPTPTTSVLPLIIEDLRAAGIQDKNIVLLTSYGSHRPMTHGEVRAKLGDWAVDNFAWINHNVWENVKDVGVTSQNNKIKVNHHFARADLRITISGIKVHGLAGYGGGGKAVLPGVAWTESINYFHRTITGNGTSKSTGPMKVFKNPVRKDMEEAGKLADVNFSVQIVYGEWRQPVDIFAGDVVTSHHAACRMANQHFRTPTSKGADIVVANTYPQSRQAMSGMSWLNRSLRDGGSGVVIAQHPDAMSTIHYMSERWSYRGQAYWETMDIKSNPAKHAGQIIIFSQYMHKRDIDRISAKHVTLAKSWDRVVELLQKNHGSEAEVAVYPYGNIQHQEIDLT